MQTISLDNFADMTQPEKAYVGYMSHAVPGDCGTRLENVYASTQDLEELVEQARQAVIEVAELVESSAPDERVNTVTLDLPCTFFMLHTQRSVLSSLRTVYSVFEDQHILKLHK